LFGNNTTTYNNTPGTYKNKYTSTDINLKYSFYVIDYLAIGGGLVINDMVQKSDDNAFKYTWNNFTFEPQVTANVPVENGLRNVFFRGGYQLGAEKFQTKSGSVTNTDKYSVSGFDLGFGHNSFFANHTAFSLYGGYRSTTIKEKDGNDKTKQRGLAFTAGLVHFF
jgi:hypothetical protein